MKIGITYTGKDDKQSNYIHWIKGSEPSIEVITLAPGETKIVEELDGLVFSGGVDIHPNCFGGAEQYDHMPRKFWKERDDFEFAVFDKAVKMELPVLGVCRGLQLINVFQKGTLVQDLSERNNRHESFIDGATEKDRTHTVVVEKHSLLGSIATNEGLVNSAHHQSIDSLGNDLMANSFAHDGVIEGIEWKKKNARAFMLAVQWHPERMDKAGIPDSPFSKNIRERFLSEVKSNGER